MSPQPRSRLPSHLRANAFRTDDRDFHGLGRGRLAASDLQRPFFGVRSVGLDLETTLGRCLAYEPLLRSGDAFSHTTAAILHGLPLGGEHAGSDLHVLAAPRTSRPRGAGVVGHESAVPFDVDFRHGLPVVSAALAWCQIAELLHRDDLVACGDAIVSTPHVGGARRPPLATIDELREAIAIWGRRRGAVALAWAIDRIRTGVDSRTETLTRLLIVAAGLPEPVVGHPVVLLDGRVVHPDLAFPGRRIAFEYEGDRHRTDARRWRSDIRRREDLEDAGWRVVRVTWDELTTHRADFTARARRLVGARSAAEATG
jgi:hypothetical protein